MNKIITIYCFLYTLTLFGQNNSETYLFSNDLIKKIEQDTVAWRYQTGATEFSFIGQYSDVLKFWDKNGVRKHKVSKADSLYFLKYKQINARNYILDQSNHAEIIIINEAHHVAEHRIFTKSLLRGLYDNGYRYLGLEALFDSTINIRKYPVMESGYYTKEPEFGNLISEALKIGFTLFNYEATPGKNGKEREIEQAENIQKFIESNPKGKVLIHCGYAHAFENEYPAWGKAMAGRLKENMEIDPFTIDQTQFLEKYDSANNHLLIRLNKTDQPIVLFDEDDNVFKGLSKTKQTDIVIIYPQTKFINNRPYWLIANKSKYDIPSSIIDDNERIMILAYRNNEFENNGIPADIIEISGEDSPKSLFLNIGNYEIVIKNKDYSVIKKYPIEIK